MDREMTVRPLPWEDWKTKPPYRAWDGCLEMRSAATPFGSYRLLRRSLRPYGRFEDLGKWFVERPGASTLGPFNDDVSASLAARADFAERARALFVEEAA